MAGSVNKVILVGNLGRDPEVRFSQAGQKIVNMSVATSENWKDRQSGERREKTEWHRVVVFDERLADICEQYLKKGARVYLEGTLQTRKWTGQDGVEKYTTEVVLPRFNGVMTMLDSRSGDGGGRDQGGGWDQSNAERGGDAPGNAGQGNAGQSGGPGHADLDDEIPF
tara:strand:+ start:1160 stop:1663 length:504 start_codon:yes stop_codon:yes gene_type:complete